MPLCAKCSKPFLCTCGAPDRKVLGAIAEDCPVSKKPGAIWVHISDDAGADVKDVVATNDGAPKPSGVDGLAVFDPVPAGRHVIDLKPLSAEILKLYQKPTADTKRRVHVNDGEIGYVMYTLPRKPALKVKVVEKGGPKLFGTATVAVSGSESASKPTDAVTGVADFGRVLAGKYEIVTTLSEEDGKTHATTVDFSKDKVPVELAAGQEQETVVEAEPLNVVTPKIEMEYKVVLLDRKLHAKQAQTETKILPGLTYVQVSADQTNKAHAFAKGGKLEFAAVTGGTVEAFLDPDCKKPFANPLTTKQLVGEEAPFKVWLRGATAGKFKATLTLDDPADRFVKLAEKPAEEEMGVVELKLEVHWFVKADIDGLADLHPDVHPVTTYHTELENLALPEQKALTDDQKVQVGRVLHVQSATDKHHDRAKLVVKQLVADQWPAGCEGYKITLSQGGATGAVLFFDGRESGAEMEAWPGPFPYVKDQDAVWWVEGKTACRALRDVVVDLGIDRAAGGLAKTAKRNGDWARFTPVKIEEVKLEYVQEPKADNAWDAAQKRYYININRKGDADGRKIHLSARLSEKIEGVPIYFMLAPDKDNRKAANWGIDFPSTGRHLTVNPDGTVTPGATIRWKDVDAGLKRKDRADRKRLLHLGAPTDKSGFVKQEVQLSRFGGDKFHPAAYIEQDPHLAKYIHGHGTLATRKPVFAAVTPVQVWRKLYYQASHPTATAMPGAGGFVASQRRVFIEAELVDTKPMAAALFPVDPYRPDWQMNGGGDATLKLVLGTHNVADALKIFIEPTLATSPKFHVLLCDEQYDARGVVTDATTIVFEGAQNVARDVEFASVNVDDGYLTLFSPPVQGGALIVSGTWTAEEDDTAFFTRKVTRKLRHSGTLAPANVTVNQTRTKKNMATITPPALCGGAAGGCPCGGKPTALKINDTHVITVILTLQGADGGYNGWAPNNTHANVVRGGRPDEQIHNTMGHEMGHLLEKVRHTHVAGWPDHPLYYQRRGGSGTHCAYHATWDPDGAAPPLDPSADNEKDAQGKGAGEWDAWVGDGACIIFGYGVNEKREWCRHCALDFIRSDLSQFA